MASLAVISDTHWRRWDPENESVAGLESLLEQGFDGIWHGGDVVDLSILEKLESYAPVVVVKGNCDSFFGRNLPHSVVESVEGVKIGMIHGWDIALDHLPSVAGAFPNDVDLIIHGHTHRRRREVLERPDGSLVTVINPGSVSSPRGGETPGYGILRVEGTSWEYQSCAFR